VAAMARRCAQWWEKGCGKRSGQARYPVRADDHVLVEGWWCVEDVAAEFEVSGRWVHAMLYSRAV